jgi:hypothetical protein
VAADGQTPQPWSYLDALGTLTRVGFERSDTSLARDPIAHGDPYHRRVSPREFRDHWADSEPDWSHGGTWLTSFVLPPKVVGDTVSTAAGHMHLPFLAPVPAAGVHLTGQRVSRLPDAIQQELPRLLEAVRREFAEVDAFDASARRTGCRIRRVYFDVSPQDRFAALQDGVRRGITSLIPLGSRLLRTGRIWQLRIDRCWSHRIGRFVAFTPRHRPDLARRCGRFGGTAPNSPSVSVGRPRRNAA